MARIEQIIKEINGVETEIYPVAIHQSVVDESNNETLDVTLAKKATHGYSEGETPKTLKQVDDDKASHGYESNPKTLKEVDNEVIQLAGDVSVKMVNFIVNGDFANGATGWKANGLLSIVGTLSADNGILSSTGNGEGFYVGIAQQTSHNRRLGDKIYARTKITEIPSGGMNTPNLTIVGNVSASGGVKGIGSGINPTTATTPVYLSGIGEVDITGSFVDIGVRMQYQNLEDQNGKTIKFDYFSAINLTATFGGGNEPTVQEMDLLMDVLGVDYFDGETTLTQVTQLSWQLKMIRQNRSAIIALGGTII